MRQRGLDFGDAATSARAPRAAAKRRGWTVSQITERIQGTLETEFHDVWVEGEVSNLKFHSSGHWYFSLKDEAAQIRAVVWRSAARLIRFRPRDGMKVLVRGGIRVYAARGEYQLSVELIEPQGKGSLQQAFEELKERLVKEGLFDPDRKRALPVLPRRVGIVTSPSGAVIRDILRVLRSRYTNLDVLIYPARVQGAEAVPEIVAGIRALGALPGLDVLIVARGGGSLEDLWAFNDEAVARALAAAPVPTLSAVGHETDFTIADFVADLRAPTPSAAAEQVVRAKQELRDRVAALRAALVAAERLHLASVRRRVEAITAHRVFEAERGRLRTHRLQLAELGRRSQAGLGRLLERTRGGLAATEERLGRYRWDRALEERRSRAGRLADRLEGLWSAGMGARRARLGAWAGRLEALSPLAVLARGYGLVWDASRQRLVRDPGEVEVGDPLRIRVRGGSFDARVSGKEI